MSTTTTSNLHSIGTGNRLPALGKAEPGRSIAGHARPVAYDRPVVTFSLERTAPLPLDEAWRRLTEWRRHGDAVPPTRSASARPAPPAGARWIVARTGAGPLAFDDRMEVTVWEPPRDDTPAGAGWRNAAGW